MEAEELKSFMRTGKELGLQDLLDNTIGDEVSRVVESSATFHEATEGLNEARGGFTSVSRSGLDEGTHIDSELFTDKKPVFDSNVVDNTSREAAQLTEATKERSQQGVEKNPAPVNILAPAPVTGPNLTKTYNQATDWKCVHCSMTIVSELRLRAHMTNKHGSTAICEKCGFKTLRWDVLQNHRRNAHLKKHPTNDLGGTTRYQCDECPYLANHPSSVKKHKQVKHEGLRYRCDQCDNSFTVKDNLLKHIKSKHVKN